MREVADATRVRGLMRALGAEADVEVAAYLTGGGTAVLVGWRDATVDVDLKLVPETDRMLRALSRLKDELRINVELAAPDDFIPVPAGWEDRSPLVAREGRMSFYHYDLYAQALAKLERAHAQDLDDVEAMLERGLIARAEGVAYFARIEPELYRFPAIDPRSFRERVELAFGA